MTRQEVKDIANEVLQENIDLTRKLLKRLPTSNVREACDLLGCSRKWLYENVHTLNGRRKNKRGDWIFDTLELVKFRNRFSKRDYP